MPFLPESEDCRGGRIVEETEEGTEAGTEQVRLQEVDQVSKSNVGPEAVPGRLADRTERVCGAAVAAGDRDQAWAVVRQAGVGSEQLREAGTFGQELFLVTVAGLTGAGCGDAVRRLGTAGFYYLSGFGQTVPGGFEVQTVGIVLEDFIRAAWTGELGKSG